MMYPWLNILLCESRTSELLAVRTDEAMGTQSRGATRRTRTADLLITNQLLYQLS